MNYRNDDSWIGVVILLFSALSVYCVWKFSNTFGLDMTASFSVVGRLAIFTVLTGVSIYSSGHYTWYVFRFGNTWPILLGIFWICWWPALDYWAINGVPSFVESELTNIWWDAWYSKLGGFVGLVGSGYLAKKLLND